MLGDTAPWEKRVRRRSACMQCACSSVATPERKAASKQLAHDEPGFTQGFLLSDPCYAAESWEADVHAEAHVDVDETSRDARSLAACCACLLHLRQICRPELMASRPGWCTGVPALASLGWLL